MKWSISEMCKVITPLCPQKVYDKNPTFRTYIYYFVRAQYSSAFSVLNNNIQIRLCCWQWIGFIWPPHLANGRRAPTVFVRLCILYLYCFQLYLCIFVLVLFVMGTITILVSSQLPVMWQRAASNRSQSDETPRLRGAGFLLLIKTTHRHHHHKRS